MAPYTLDILPYQTRWPHEFEAIGATFRTALGELALRIDHIGSTAVPGLVAKDVIDIQVTVQALTPAVEEAFKQIGFIRPDREYRDHEPPGFTGNRNHWEKWMVKPPEGSRRINTHVRIQGRANQRYPILFRDYLRAHPNTAEAYGELKQRLRDNLTDLRTYPEVKDPAVDLIYFPAEVWATQTQWEPGASDI